MSAAKTLLIYVGWAIVTLLPLLLFVLPWFVMLPVVSMSLWWVKKGKRAEVLLLIGSLLFTFACTELAVRMMADQLFYREHERFAKHGRYLPNVDATLPVAHGDLVAMDPSIKALANPHQVRFQSDGDGFRNANDYANEPYVLLGDSFIAGVGNSASDTLAAQINRIKPASVYSLGYPGEPADYQNLALEFLRTHPENKAKFIWFIYEGNDLVLADAKTEFEAPPSAAVRFLSKLSVRELPLLAPRFLTILYKRLGAMTRGKSSAATSSVVTKKINGVEMAFYQPYIELLQHDALKLNLEPNEVLFKRSGCVFIIPDKSHVYGAQTGDKNPSATYDAVAKIFTPYHIPIINLSQMMQVAANNALDKGELIYWADDTHWNAKGIAIAAREVLSCLTH